VQLTVILCTSCGESRAGLETLCPYLSLSAGLAVEGLMCSSNSSQSEGPWAAS
jgi:hypothetical protein